MSISDWSDLTMDSYLILERPDTYVKAVTPTIDTGNSFALAEDVPKLLPFHKMYLARN
jgi:hypothetical protein